MIGTRRRKVGMDDLDTVVVERSGPAIAGDRVAVVAQFSRGARISRSLNEYIRQLRSHEYRVIVVSASPVEQALAWDPDIEGEITVLRKENLGYDFGSWAVGLAWDETIPTLDHVILCNDSLLGPFDSIGPILEGFESTGADVYGMTDTTQFSHHVQSYFLGFRRGVLAEPPLRRFWSNIVHLEDKTAVIHRNELGLSRLFRQEGYSTTAAFPHQRAVAPGENPTIRGWRTLIELGFPFVKREVVRSPEVAPQGDQVPGFLTRRFGVLVEDWL